LRLALLASESRYARTWPTSFVAFLAMTMLLAAFDLIRWIETGRSYDRLSTSTQTALPS
jgi:hypothetical protein